ncbi:hypothetical protein E2C01_086481 [Portunus trituberculatus]|uniref:Uncharacterized protein n=1 Tax=Portunus trituberculatus TaxID=210409 RepID=A0A5B7JAF2_PORTR|nr:hypothetical protein [Portunus trituberculatus]
MSQDSMVGQPSEGQQDSTVEVNTWPACLGSERQLGECSKNSECSSIERQLGECSRAKTPVTPCSSSPQTPELPACFCISIFCDLNSLEEVVSRLLFLLWLTLLDVLGDWHVRGSFCLVSVALGQIFPA